MLPCNVYYDPAIVFFPAQPGIVVVDAIRFDFFVTIGEFFRPWGWGIAALIGTRTW
jgi:hypothetical protein